MHVGLAKTATTTIQIWADRGREQLVARNIHYPKAGVGSHEPKHQELVNSLIKSDNSIWSPWAEHDAEIVFLSAEGLTGHLNDFSETSLLRFRACHSRRVSIFLNTRDEEPWLASLWRQRLFNPTYPELGYGTDMTLTEFRHHPRVQALLDPALPQRLADSFGADEVVVGKLELDWAERLCRLLGVEELAPELRAASHANRGISMAAAELVRQANGMGLSAGARACLLRAVEQVEGTQNVVGDQYNRFTNSLDNIINALAVTRALNPQDKLQGDIQNRIVAALNESRIRLSNDA